MPTSGERTTMDGPDHASTSAFTSFVLPTPEGLSL